MNKDFILETIRGAASLSQRQLAVYMLLFKTNSSTLLILFRPDMVTDVRTQAREEAAGRKHCRKAPAMGAFNVAHSVSDTLQLWLVQEPGLLRRTQSFHRRLRAQLPLLQKTAQQLSDQIIDAHLRYDLTTYTLMACWFHSSGP